MCNEFYVLDFLDLVKWIFSWSVWTWYFQMMLENCARVLSCIKLWNEFHGDSIWWKWQIVFNSIKYVGFGILMNVITFDYLFWPFPRGWKWWNFVCIYVFSCDCIDLLVVNKF